ncbi:hypothetical protein N7468_010656 [Penicillium chermesinum]|uniref:Major facilitator superfamily (MFS) profile domain-containing protein n=1 Tax=Penicillium chermesinum TaxID=63820 RepID=A0A9W9N816_9EURO|nr:uncharacterized protein N7468_010656 [Penicillium chermesinum]KAJ5214977.1 hypothetical protein N7468_010656 [Penicillium chermesinum]
MQIFIRNRTGFLITRSILGLAEAGFIPGAMFTLSMWYTQKDITVRIAIFFFGMFGGTAVGPLIGAGLLKLDGKGGLWGWQWIFLGEAFLKIAHWWPFELTFSVVEGVWTVLVSIALLALLPGGPADGIPQDAEGTTHLDLSTGESSQPKIPMKVVWKTVTNFRKWPHFLATACVFATWSPLTTYTPSIMVSLGFSRISANALAAIGNFITLPVVLLFAWAGGKLRKWGFTVMTAQACYLIALIALRCIQPHVGTWSKFGLWTTANGLAVGYHPVHNAWIQVNSGSPEERSINMA